MKDSEGTWLLYLLVCADGSFYVGMTADLSQRWRAHKGGHGSRYVAAHAAGYVAAIRVAGDRKSASRLERKVKAMTRAKKIKFFRPVPYVGEMPPLLDA